MSKETVNGGALVSGGWLRMYVSKPDPELSAAADRARLYEAAPKLLAACKGLMHAVHSVWRAAEDGNDEATRDSIAIDRVMGGRIVEIKAAIAMANAS